MDQKMGTVAAHSQILAETLTLDSVYARLFEIVRGKTRFARYGNMEIVRISPATDTRVLKNKPWYQKAATDLRTKGHASISGFAISSGGSGG